jgi:hypothetical protein
MSSSVDNVTASCSERISQSLIPDITFDRFTLFSSRRR